MDPDFLNQLDSHISNIGIDKCWKKQIGDHLIWFSPLTATAQGKVNETLADEDLGINAISETKRITLAHAIVGIDDYDLQEYRDAGPVFSIPGKKKGEKVKVVLDKYIYTKMRVWGNDWLDLAFEIFADLMESFSKENRKDVKFENVKDPQELLVELEMQVAELRKELGMPQLIESEEEPEEEEAQETAEEAQEEPDEAGVALEDFDPFKTAPDTTGSQEEPIPGPAPVAQPTPPEPALVEPVQEAPQNPQAVVSVPTPDPAKLSPIEQAIEQRAHARRAQPQGAVGGRKIIDAKESSLEHPINPTPSVPRDEIVDKPVDRPSGPVKVDKKTKHQSRNPRFKKPDR